MASEPTFVMQSKHGFFEIAHHQHATEDRQTGLAIEW
jgi:hypothetical protein